MFLVFEGLDGSGKSTLMQNFKAWLEDQNKASDQKVHLSREPGGSLLGEEIRKILLEVKQEADYKISPRAELLLYEASRAQHVEQKIRPLLEGGDVVLCDRFTASSIAFQAGGRELSTEQVEWLNDFATHDCQPDLQIFVDLDFESCRLRKKNLDEPLDRIEQEKRDFHDKVYQSYKQQAQAQPSKWCVLDGHLKPEEILQALVDELQQRGILKV